jgi:hypothetical protein
MIGVKSDHISEMEKGKRPIGKEMAQAPGQGPERLLQGLFM